MNLDLDENRNVPDPSRSHELITTRLSQDEFAEYLNLKANSGFVRQMFQIAGSDENDFITIREFLNIIVLFEKGELLRWKNSWIPGLKNFSFLETFFYLELFFLSPALTFLYFERNRQHAGGQTEADVWHVRPR